MSTLDNVVMHWQEYYVLALVQNTIFLSLVLLVLRLLRDRPARLRYVVALVGLVKLLIPPLLPVPEILRSSSSSGWFGDAIASSFPAARWWSSLDAITAPAADPVSSGGSLGPAALLFLCWAVGVLVALVVPGLFTLRLAARLRRSERIHLGPSLQTELGPKLGVWRSPEIEMPMVLPFFPHRIFVPSSWDRWPEDKRRLFLLHERAHLRHHDGLVQGLMVFAHALFWVHPLVHRLEHELDELREMACDDACLEPVPHHATRYARYLVEAAEAVMRAPGLRRGVFDTASRLVRRRHELRARVDYQLARVRESSSSEKGTVMSALQKLRLPVVVGALCLLVLPLSWSWSEERPRAGESENRTQDTPPSPGHQNVRIDLHGEGRMDIGGESTDVLQFSQAMLGLGRGDSERVVLDLHCAADLPMNELHAYQEIFRKAGFDRVRYVDPAGKALPMILPPADVHERLAGMKQEHTAVVQIVSADEILIDGEGISPAHLRDEIAKRVAADEHLVVSLTSDTATHYGDWVVALASLKEAGVGRLALLPPVPPKE